MFIDMYEICGLISVFEELTEVKPTSVNAITKHIRDI